MDNNGQKGGDGFQYGKYSYKHYLVEASFQGHDEFSSAEMIIRKENGHLVNRRLHHQYGGDHYGINQGGGRSIPFQSLCWKI